jgi:dienelactone hydrolase
MASSLFKTLSAPSIRAGSRLLIYPAAGHLISKSLLPAGSTLVARGRIETGGSPAANAAAGRDAWPRVLSFLRKTLATEVSIVSEANRSRQQ